MDRNAMIEQLNAKRRRMSEHPARWGHPETYVAARLALLAIEDILLNGQAYNAVWQQLWTDSELATFGSFGFHNAHADFTGPEWQPVYAFISDNFQKLHEAQQLRVVDGSPFAIAVGNLIRNATREWPGRLDPLQFDSFILELMVTWELLTGKVESSPEKQEPGPTPAPSSVPAPRPVLTMLAYYDEHLRSICSQYRPNSQYSTLAGIATSRYILWPERIRCKDRELAFTYVTQVMESLEAKLVRS